MKSTLTTIICVLVAAQCFSQFSKGDKFVGGGFSVQTRKNSSNDAVGATDELNSYSVDPRLGFFVRDKLALGFVFGYSGFVSRNHIPNNYKTEVGADNYNLGIFVRRYFPISEKFFFFIDGGLNYSRGKSSSTTTDFGSATTITTDSKNQEWTFYASPRFVFFPSQKWGIEAGLGSLSYSRYSSLDSEATTNRFNANYGIFSLGFAYYVRK